MVKNDVTQSVFDNRQSLSDGRCCLLKNAQTVAECLLRSLYILGWVSVALLSRVVAGPETEQDAIEQLQKLGAVVKQVALEDGTRAWSVSLDYVRCDPSLWLRELSRLGAVVELNLHKTATDEKVIQELAALPSLSRLQKLDLSMTHVANAGLASLQKFSELRELNASHMWLGSKAEPLFSCYSLESLDLSVNSLTGHDLEGIDRLTQLRKLAIDTSDLGDELVPYLVRLARLHSLTIRCGGGDQSITDDGVIELVSGLLSQAPDMGPPLEKLVLFRQDVGARGIIEGVSKLKNLRELELVGSAIGDEGVRAIAQMKQLEDLKIFGRVCSPEALGDLAQLRNLRRLILSYTTVTDEVLDAYRSLTELRILGLWRSFDITDAGVAHLLNLSRLEEVNLGSAKNLTDASTLTLAQLPSLKRLAISRGITDEGLHHLGQIDRLTHLDFDHTKGLTRAGLVELRGLKSLEMLNLSGMELSDEDLALLLDFPRLKALEISSPSVSDGGLKSLCRMTQLRQLSVVFTNISAEGRKELYDKLPQCDPVAPDWLAW